MKKSALAFFIVAVCFAGIYAANSKKSIQIADVYVCESEKSMAELQALVNVSRSELYIASYCSCEGIDASIKNRVQIKRVFQNMDENGKITREEKPAECVAPKNRVYACVCVGRSAY